MDKPMRDSDIDSLSQDAAQETAVDPEYLAALRSYLAAAGFAIVNAEGLAHAMEGCGWEFDGMDPVADAAAILAAIAAPAAEPRPLLARTCPKCGTLVNMS